MNEHPVVGEPDRSRAQGASAVVDLRAGLEHARWSLALNVKNATNGDDIVTLGENGALPDGTIVYGASVLEPRTVELTFTGYF